MSITYLCLGCKVPDLIFSSSSRRRTSSSWMRGLGAGLGGIVGSWMKGWDGCTLFRIWLPTQGCTDPDRSVELRRDPSWPAILLDPVVLLKHKVMTFWVSTIKESVWFFSLRPLLVGAYSRRSLSHAAETWTETHSWWLCYFCFDLWGAPTNKTIQL